MLVLGNLSIEEFDKSVNAISKFQSEISRRAGRRRETNTIESMNHQLTFRYETHTMNKGCVKRSVTYGFRLKITILNRSRSTKM